MGNQSYRILVWGLLILVSISCVTINIGQKPAAPVNSNDSIQMTVQAIQGGWNQGNNPTAIPTSGSFASSNNYSATPTGDNYAPPPPPQDSSSANQPQQTPCLLLGKVRDITVSDGYQMDAGSTANKTWELTNGGFCSWDANFQIVDAGGTLPKSVQTKAIGKSVAPGGTVQITVPVVAPSQAGTYTAYYKMRSSSGSSFGSGTDANSAFWVKIIVPGQPVQPPQDGPTSLILNVSYVNSVQTFTNKPCPYKVTLTAVVTPNKNISEIFYFYCSETKTKYIFIGQGNMTANQPSTISSTITLENSAKRTFLLCNDTVQRCYSPGISVNLACQQKFAITALQWSKSKYTTYSNTSSFSVYPSLSITSNAAGSIDYKIGTTGSSLSLCTSRVWQGRVQFTSAQTQLVGNTSGLIFLGPCSGQIYFYAKFPDGTERTWYVPLEAIKN